MHAPHPTNSAACFHPGLRLPRRSYTYTPSRWPPRRRLISSDLLIPPRLSSLTAIEVGDCVFMGNTPSCILLAVAAPAAGGGGRASSSSSSAAAAAATNTTTKVIHADGTVTRLARPVRASELMLDHPGQFVCDARRLAVGCRVPGVAADELLQPRHACYFLLPMDMLYSVLTDDEMAALSDSHAATAAAASAWKRIRVTTAPHPHRGAPDRRHVRRGPAKDEPCSDGARVYPMLGLLATGDLGADNNNKPQLRAGRPAGKSGGGGGGAGLRRHRPWQPVLDTIEEVP
ncbi:hypothetical protein BDA96_03G098500 [Sorghum bicolor]|uniref:DUF4228 domain-containing protein n=1 Tax=Sorghum bicolor TaxID=4558 RepID=A0A921RA95_SORBI|nr:hypothetical protein BDA96_03G098500 [Sorghum bicolor]